MSTVLRRRILACSILLAFVLVLLAPHSLNRAAAQNPLFPNTQSTYYSPYGQGTYGRYGNSINLPPAFRTTAPDFVRPASALPFYYRASSPGIYNFPYNYNGNYIQNSGNGSYYHPLGY